ncbi:MAG: hypothetical protein QXH03_04490 [Candidatus Bathyarchaeia archaeon]
MKELKSDQVSALAPKIEARRENVYQDSQVLRKMGFVRLNKKKGKVIIPETLVKETAFLIR